MSKPLSEQNLWPTCAIDKAARASLKAQRPACLWLTGLSGAGKSTVAGLLEKRLHDLGRHTYVLDGDKLRGGLCSDLGFTDADRVEQIRRVSETARMLVDAGLIVIVAVISPFRRSETRPAAISRQVNFSKFLSILRLPFAKSVTPKVFISRRGKINYRTSPASAHRMNLRPRRKLRFTAVPNPRGSRSSA